MNDYPADVESRSRVRTQIGLSAATEAQRKAAVTGRSTKCAGDLMAVQHAGTDGGCANDGSTCICECHDPKGDR